MSEPAWERIQKKTFTKWCNNHLGKAWGASTEVVDILNDWETGILLMKLAVALYKENDKHPEQAITMPTLKASEEAPKSRIQMINNGGKALALLAQAGCKLRGVSAENLVDHDKVAILGMIWMIILDYASRGFGGSSAEVKRALLEWVNKQTTGYEKVNPPGVTNFTKNWRNGLAFCALIHRHRPELLNYDDCLKKSNAENLELAFSLAHDHVGIPRLLDVADVDTEDQDEKSIMTYVMEYFLAFAGDGLREAAAKQASDWLKFLQEVRNRQNDYERRARLLVAFMNDTQDSWSNKDMGSSKADAEAIFDELRAFVGQTKPVQEMEKMDLEALFAEIQTILTVNNLARWTPPAGLAPHELQTKFDNMLAAQSAFGTRVREEKFKYIEKKDDSAQEEAIAADIRTSFRHYDENNNGSLNKSEFLAACMEMGVALKTQDEKDALFSSVGGGGDVTLAQYDKWMRARMVMKMDNPDSAKAAFRNIANGGATITAAQLNTQPLTDDDRAFLMANMPQMDDGSYDYASFIDAWFSS